MLSGILGGMFDLPKQVKSTIENSLKEFAEELNCSPKEIFVMIKGVSDKGEFNLYLYKTEDGKQKYIRPVELSEIIE